MDTYDEIKLKKMVMHAYSKINDNEKVCIIGLNGAGKSTILNLLLRFYDVTEGEILINGININELEIGELRRCFSAYFQKMSNYAFTLKENIELSDIYINDIAGEKVITALQYSDALELIEEFPEGVNQYITKKFDENGVELSGGQYQKIALARTLHRDTKVLLLDEPSAFLDPEAEYRLISSLEEYCMEKTLIYTTHRLSNVRLADYIILMEEGEIIEMGAHEELIKQSGRYAQLYEYQNGNK